jgi:hypothetical protein
MVYTTIDDWLAGKKQRRHNQDEYTRMSFLSAILTMYISVDDMEKAF